LRAVPFPKRAGLLDTLSPSILVFLWAGTQKEGEEPALLVVKNAARLVGRALALLLQSAKFW